MDGLKFDAMARRLGSGLTRRQALRGLAAGAVAVTAGGTALADVSAAKKKNRCLRAGKPCDKSTECCPKETGRICKQPNPPSGSKVCCSTKGERCGGERPSGPVKPQCCWPLECSNKKGGKCR